MPYEVVYKGRNARWLPEDHRELRRYHHVLLVELVEQGVYSKSGEVDEKQFSLVILQLKKLIEENAEIFRDFNEMFAQVPPNPEPDQYSITNYLCLLAVLNKTISRAPTFDNTSPVSSGVPMYAVLAPFCNTEAGYRAFTNSKVNAMFHKIFDQWSRFLVSPASRNVLVTSEGGWFSPDSMQIQDENVGTPFAKAFVCFPDKPYMGFTSWDDFFVRRFREGVRPVFCPDRPELINNACEAITYRFVKNVQLMDEFWVKGYPYSLNHILDNDPLASQFDFGKVYQAMLSSFAYHRWSSPVDGRVVRTRIVPGTYFAARVDGYHQDPDVLTRSQGFVTSISARALIFIESNNPNVGLMCFVGVGLAEVSTTQIAVREGDLVKKGDEIGSFHFGGSTHLLVFRKETDLTLLDDPDHPNNPEQARWINRALFHVDNPPL